TSSPVNIPPKRRTWKKSVQPGARSAPQRPASRDECVRSVNPERGLFGLRVLFLLQFAEAAINCIQPSEDFLVADAVFMLDLDERRKGYASLKQNSGAAQQKQEDSSIFHGVCMGIMSSILHSLLC